MSGKADMRVCRYPNCRHASNIINIGTEKFVKDGRSFYHEDCYAEKAKEEAKEENKKKDFQFIRSLWVTHINNMVVYGELFRTLNDLVSKGLDSKYLVFTVRYCIDHGFHLNHPGGLRYFVNNDEIKKAYSKRNYSAVKKQSDEYVAAAVKNDDNSPKFNAPQKKPKGFQSVLKDHE